MPLTLGLPVPFFKNTFNDIYDSMGLNVWYFGAHNFTRQVCIAYLQTKTDLPAKKETIPQGNRNPYLGKGGQPIVIGCLPFTLAVGFPLHLLLPALTWVVERWAAYGCRFSNCSYPSSAGALFTMRKYVRVSLNRSFLKVPHCGLPLRWWQ